jgi:hypothetical protein
MKYDLTAVVNDWKGRRHVKNKKRYSFVALLLLFQFYILAIMNGILLRLC